LGSDAGAGAVTAALALPGLVALALVGKGRARWAMLPMSIGVGLAVATSGSRGAIVVVFVTLVVFGLTAAASKNALRAVIGIALGVALVYAAFVQLGAGNASTERARSIAPSRALSTFQGERGHSVSAFGGLASGHPLGVGIGTSGPAARVQQTADRTVYNTETEWNFLIVETGIAGLVVYVALLLRMAWLAFTRIRRIDDHALRLQLAALAAPVVGMLLSGFSGATSASVPTAPYLWIVAGMLAYWLITTQRGEPDRMKAMCAEAVVGEPSTRGSLRQRPLGSSTGAAL
jgi:O-antigen ligase